MIVCSFIVKDNNSKTHAIHQLWNVHVGDRTLVFEVRVPKKKRSSEQNDRYFAIIDLISKHINVEGKKYSKDAWHEYFKQEFIGCDELPSGRVAGKSSKNLSKQEFSDFMMQVEAFAASNGVFLGGEWYENPNSF